MYPAAPNGAGRIAKDNFVVLYVDTVTGEHKSVEFRKNNMIYPFVMGAGRSPENFLRSETWIGSMTRLETGVPSSHSPMLPSGAVQESAWVNGCHMLNFASSLHQYWTSGRSGSVITTSLFSRLREQSKLVTASA
ncbi:hypothetical protein M427DRAFT_355126 [Gonapodya prolifera JEL478]|uniref:Uncharacterized protein n=1 Tax=Gonapodya prolifera (strain JEL478) TaxID=1344416 RepID=A0A139ABM5_GONPJ|nr:hypothetical protein M427DRAFT_355126 [Gonapodya prolifera JEL478]|eukprot:KXS14147.1 hypothetical protein M427DRAFT_355126 [Gonapodya prolifera JEL478]